MKIITKCHLQVISETVELSILAGFLGLCVGAGAVYVDLMWLNHDIATNGLNADYAFFRNCFRWILFGLFVAGGITLKALWLHHKNNVHARLYTVYMMKRNVAIARRRHGSK